jgi:hypothetical protein
MSSLANLAERCRQPDLASYVPQDELQQCLDSDDFLLIDLAQQAAHAGRHYSAEVGLGFAHRQVADYARPVYGSIEARKLELVLQEHGTLDLREVRDHQVRVGNELHDVVLLPATKIGEDVAHHGDMSAMVYLRDQIQTASALMELGLRDADRYEAEKVLGKELLLSSLHLLSTESQLMRFQEVIKLGPKATQADWPHISLHFSDLEATAESNGWRNKQDTIAMLAYHTLDALERGYIEPSDLLDSHKQMLGSVVPFLAALGFPLTENCGSWEEVAAHRTSVMAVETALLHKMQRLTTERNDLAFLQEGYETAYDQVADVVTSSFPQALEQMVQAGLSEIGRRLPYESPDYDTDDVKYREADATLVYLLRYDIPKLLADRAISIACAGGQPLDRGAIEAEILQQLFSLMDPVTNGIRRYQGDAYLRVNFLTDSVQLAVGGIKLYIRETAQNGEPDLDRKQELRDDITPAGPAAAWTHPLGQIASWAATRYDEAMSAGDYRLADRYLQLSSYFLNAMLSTVTGADQPQVVIGGDGQRKVTMAVEGELSECWIAFETPDGGLIRAPSPHSPLNWSVAMLREVLGILSTCEPMRLRTYPDYAAVQSVT